MNFRWLSARERTGLGVSSQPLGADSGFFCYPSAEARGVSEHGMKLHTFTRQRPWAPQRRIVCSFTVDLDSGPLASTCSGHGWEAAVSVLVVLTRRTSLCGNSLRRAAAARVPLLPYPVALPMVPPRWPCRSLRRAPCWSLVPLLTRGPFLPPRKAGAVTLCTWSSFPGWQKCFSVSAPLFSPFSVIPRRWNILS